MSDTDYENMTFAELFERAQPADILIDSAKARRVLIQQNIESANESLIELTDDVVNAEAAAMKARNEVGIVCKTLKENEKELDKLNTLLAAIDIEDAMVKA